MDAPLSSATRGYNRVNNAGIPDEVALESFYDQFEI